MANIRQDVKNGCGSPLGWIETDEQGNKKIYSFSRGILGFYYKYSNRTVTVCGQIIAFSDCSAALLFE